MLKARNPDERAGAQPSAPAAETDELREQLRRSRTETEVVDTLRRATPQQRLEVAPDAVTRLAERELRQDTEHVLQPYAQLLPPNPRSVKRFVMDYGALRAARTAEGSTVAQDTLAVWTVLRSRWPALADHLRSRPGHIDLIGNPAGNLDGVDPSLLPLFADADGSVREVIGFNRTRITADDVRDCTGVAD